MGREKINRKNYLKWRSHLDDKIKTYADKLREEGTIREFLLKVDEAVYNQIDENIPKYVDKGSLKMTLMLLDDEDFGYEEPTSYEHFIIANYVSHISERRGMLNEVNERRYAAYIEKWLYVIMSSLDKKLSYVDEMDEPSMGKLVDAIIFKDALDALISVNYITVEKRRKGTEKFKAYADYKSGENRDEYDFKEPAEDFGFKILG